MISPYINDETLNPLLVAMAHLLMFDIPLSPTSIKMNGWFNHPVSGQTTFSTFIHPQCGGLLNATPFLQEDTDRRYSVLVWTPQISDFPKPVNLWIPVPGTNPGILDNQNPCLVSPLSLATGSTRASPVLGEGPAGSATVGRAAWVEIAWNRPKLENTNHWNPLNISTDLNI